MKIAVLVVHVYWGTPEPSKRWNWGLFLGYQNLKHFNQTKLFLPTQEWSVKNTPQ